MTPQEALGAIAALEKFGINLGLGRAVACLDALGNPHRGYPCLHVGGTNGKGSTSLLLADVLSAAGHRTGLYTSPPLEFFGERIRVDGGFLPDAAVPDLYQAVLGAGRARPDARDMTQFEVITAMAFLHFARAGAEVAVIEVGLGGRLDSTNVLEPLACAVTNVGLEHAEHLGSTVAEIAREKAGIARPGVPLVTAAEGEALASLEAAAKERGAPVLAFGRDFSTLREPGGTWSFRGSRWTLGGLELGLAGAHQGLNLGVSLALLETVDAGAFPVSEGAVRGGLAAARWPGRLELIHVGEKRVLLDGAHNPHASRVLAAALAEGFPRRRLLFVLGILGDKDARSILSDLVPLADRVFFTRSSSARALEPEELEILGRQVGVVPSRLCACVPEALDEALSAADPGDLVCVTGSLTTVGEARGHLRTRGWVP